MIHAVFAIAAFFWLCLGIIAIFSQVKKVRVSLHQIKGTLNHINARITTVRRARVIEFWSFTGGQFRKVRNMNLQQGENAALVLAIKDAGGNAAHVQDDKVEWSVSDSSLGDLQIAPDFMSALFVPNGTVGSCQVQAMGDADLGEGVKSIMGFVDINVLSGEAVVMELSATAVPK